MNFSLKPNFKVAGPVLGSKVKAFGKALGELDSHETVEKLESGGEKIDFKSRRWRCRNF